MATSITPVSLQIAEYLSNNFSAEDDFLSSLRKEAMAADIPAINISGEQGAFLQVLLLAMNAKYVLEIGSLAGYSAILMARALPSDGKVFCIEYNADYCDFIKRKAQQAGLSNVIEVHHGKGLDVLQTLLLEHPLDFVFIDADKPNYTNYLHAALPLLRAGGVVCGDNTLAWGEIANDTTNHEPANVHALQQFNQAMRNHPQLKSTLVPLGDGMTMGVKS